MGSKLTYIIDKSSTKLKKLNTFLYLIIYGMAGVLIHDAIIHKTPLYYMAFYFVGLLVGRVYLRLIKIQHEENSQQFILTTSKWDIYLSAFLLLVRFIYGITLLEAINIVWASDALYLFFIGLYRSKCKGLISQFDEIVYKWIASSKVLAN